MYELISTEIAQIPPAFITFQKPNKLVIKPTLPSNHQSHYIMIGVIDNEFQSRFIFSNIIVDNYTSPVFPLGSFRTVNNPLILREGSASG